MNKQNNISPTLYESSGKYSIIVSTILILSFIFNVSALIAPFYTAKVFLKSPYTFTLPNSVLLMWNHQLLLIALLILGFSIIFPFFKLIVLFYTWFICRDGDKREKSITFIGPLGKWSMLDIFMTIILIVMTNNQFMITSTLKIGVYFFLVAIFMSMSCALIIERIILKKGIDTKSENKLFIKRFEEASTKRRTLVISILIVSLITLIMAVNTPIIQINDFFFASNEYSIATSAITLWNTSLLLAFFVLFTLIICPLLHILGLLIMWTVKLKPVNSYRMGRLIQIVSLFNMLDVFCLALLIFISEGSTLISTHNKPGLFILLIFVLCAYLIPIFIKGTHKDYLQYIKRFAQAQHKLLEKFEKKDL